MACKLMKITRETLSNVEDNLRAKFTKSGMPFTEEDVTALALHEATQHNVKVEIFELLGGSIMYTDATGQRDANIKYIKDVKVDLRADTVTIIEKDGKQYTFPYGNYASTPTKNGTVKYSEGLAAIMNQAKPFRDILNNHDMNEKEIDRVFLTHDTTDGTIHEIQQQMRILDIESLGESWDQEHSDDLAAVVKHISSMSSEIKDMKIEVTKEAVDEYVQPLGEFDPNKPDTKVRLVKSSLGEEARNKLTMTNEEAMTHELVHAALDWIFNNEAGVQGETLKRHIRNLYKQAQAKITWKDLLPADRGVYTQEEEAEAKKRYTYIFEGVAGNHNTTTANIRLQEFMAYLMTNKELGMALDKIKPAIIKAKKQNDESLVETLARLIVDAFKLVISNLRKIKGRTLQEEAVKLVYAMTEVQDVYASKAAQSKHMPLDTKISNLFTKGTDAIDKTMAKPVDFLFEKVIGEPRRNITKEEFMEVMNITKKELPAKGDSFLKKVYKLSKVLPRVRVAIEAGDKFGRQDVAVIWNRHLQEVGLGEGSFAHDFLADFSGGRKTLEQITDQTMEFRAHIDRIREQGFKGTLIDIKDMFKNIPIYGKRSKAFNQALESVVMTADVQSMGITDMNELHKLVSNKNHLKKEIENLEDELIKVNAPGDGEILYVGEMYIKDANEAAKFLVTGEGLRTNARNISRLFGSDYAIPYITTKFDSKSFDPEEYVAKIDKLISLKALQLTKGNDKLAELLKIDPQGVKDFMDYARGVQLTTYEEMAKDEPENYIKGQMRDTVNKNHAIEMAPMYKKEEMKALGFKYVRPAEASNIDGSLSKFGIFISENVSITKRVDGAVSLQRRSVSGLLLSDKVRMGNPQMTDSQVFQEVKEVIFRAEALYKTGKSDNKMQPVYNNDGDITDFRYGVTKADKIKYLDLEVRGTEVLSKSFGQVGTMTMTNTQNRSLIDQIFKDSKARNTEGLYTNTESLYITVAPKEYNISDEARRKLYESGKSELIDKGKHGLKTEGEEIWSLLPPDAREYIIEKNNAEDRANGIDPQDRRELHVRKDLIKQLFAYNEPSMFDFKLFDRMSEVNKRKAKIAESYWKDFMVLLKSNVVIKLPATVWGNIMSNAKFLLYAGVPPRKAVEYLALSMQSLRQWKEDEHLMHKYERLVASKEGAEKIKNDRLLADVKARLDGNPIKPLMDAGMYQSIVEDVELVDDTNKISGAVSGVLEKHIGDKGLLHDVVQTAFLTKRSALGRFLVGVTQESDFHFRAATYWHGMATGRPEKEVMREVTDNFINYSKVIQSKLMQWLDRMGPEAFYKYFSNIQRVQLKRLRYNTSRVMLDWVGQASVGLPNGIFNSSIFNQFSRRFNPFDDGPLGNLFEGGMEIPIFHLFGK